MEILSSYLIDDIINIISDYYINDCYYNNYQYDSDSQIKNGIYKMDCNTREAILIENGIFFSIKQCGRLKLYYIDCWRNFGYINLTTNDMVVLGQTCDKFIDFIGFNNNIVYTIVKGNQLCGWDYYTDMIVHITHDIPNIQDAKIHNDKLIWNEFGKNVHNICMYDLNTHQLTIYDSVRKDVSKFVFHKDIIFHKRSEFNYVSSTFNFNTLQKTETDFNKIIQPCFWMFVFYKDWLCLGYEYYIIVYDVNTLQMVKQIEYDYYNGTHRWFIVNNDVIFTDVYGGKNGCFFIDM
jgi:hypothetical protein